MPIQDKSELKKDLLKLLIDIHNFVIDEYKYRYNPTPKFDSHASIHYKQSTSTSQKKEQIKREPSSKDLGDIPELDFFLKSTDDDSNTVLDLIKSRCLTCSRCALSQSRIQVVFGDGNAQADLMFVGEAPGAEEDKQGIPFVGRAGQLLTLMIQAIGLDRRQVFIGNILKCRPPNNRNPNSQEIETCTPWLDLQLKVIKPKLIVTLGTFASQYILNSREPISKIRGQLINNGDYYVLPTFHPSYLIRPASYKYKAQAWEDLKKIARFLELR